MNRINSWSFLFLCSWVVSSLTVVAIAGERSGFCCVYTQNFSEARVLEDTGRSSGVWLFNSVIPFNESIVSWDAARPQGTGYFDFFIRVKRNTWSKWLYIAQWGATVQKSFFDRDEALEFAIDTLTLTGENCACALEVKAVACNGASLDALRNISVCCTNTKKYKVTKPEHSLQSIEIKNVPRQSQMLLKHKRYSDLCSPTSTSIVTSFWLNNDGLCVINPADFAELAYDQKNDIYGNWVLNVAAACDVGGGKVHGFVGRLNGFENLYDYLVRAIPVVVSVKGPLKGGATPYSRGHLMVVVGWDQKARKVICIDPAFRSNEATRVRYSLDDFLEAWGRRKNLCYILASSI
jgi:hypothetical protein